jgi:hypothetical protein
MRHNTTMTQKFYSIKNALDSRTLTDIMMQCNTINLFGAWKTYILFDNE